MLAHHHDDPGWSDDDGPRWSDDDGPGWSDDDVGGGSGTTEPGGPTTMDPGGAGVDHTTAARVRVRFQRPGDDSSLPTTGIAVAGVLLLGLVFVMSGFGTRVLGRQRHA